MSYVNTLVGGAGAASVVVSEVCTLGGGITCVGDALLNISTILWSAAVRLSPSAVSGLVGVGLRRGC